MSNTNDYAAKIETAKNLDKKQIQVPYIPVGIYLQEAEDLSHWSKDDLEELVKAGLQKKSITDLPILTGACREAQSLWMKDQQTRKEAEEKWSIESPKAFDFRNQLLHSFRYAFRNNPELMSNVDEIAEGYGNADMVQDLNDLAILGKGYIKLFEAINFDMALLDEAAAKSDELATLLASANGDRLSENELKEMRDRMYTLLKHVVDEIRDCGKYVFWRDENRLKGYTSAYQKRLNAKKRKPEEVLNNNLN